MELREFIKETLLQLMQGVKDAQDETKDLDAVINPETVSIGGDRVYTAINNTNRMVQYVSFEIGLTSTTDDSIKKGIGVNLGGVLNTGGGKDHKDSNSSATKISFEIPVVLPSIPNGNEIKPYNITPRTNKHSY